jgi:hydrogenase-4 transcriptional activator
LVPISLELLDFYLKGIRHHFGSSSAALFVRTLSHNESTQILLQDGSDALAPELSDEVSANSFVEKVRNNGSSQVSLLNNPASAYRMWGVDSQRPESILIALVTHETLALQAAWRAIKDSWQQPSRRVYDPGQTQKNHARHTAWLALNFNTIRDKEEFCKKVRQHEDYLYQWLFILGGAIGRHVMHIRGVLNDSVTGLAGPAELNQCIEELVEGARFDGRSFCLLMLGPESYEQVNEHFGRDAGDAILKEVALKLQERTRSTDSVCRYGGAVFSLILRETESDGAYIKATSLIDTLDNESFLERQIKLKFNVGLVCCDAASLQIPAPLDIIRRGAQALHNAKMNQERVHRWHSNDVGASADEIERLTGIVTGHMGKDYRNMVLMWEVLSVIAGTNKVESLVNQTLLALQSAFQPRRTGVFELSSPDEVRLIRGLTASSDVSRRSPVEVGPGNASFGLALDEEDKSFLLTCLKHGATLGSGVHGTQEFPLSKRAVAIPLTVQAKVLATFYMELDEKSTQVDITDLQFLKGLVGQLAVAMDRARLSEENKMTAVKERNQLRHETNELREVLGSARIVYRSELMESLFVTLRQVAPTDATILLSGESGTGKGLIAQTIHSFSQRRDKPMTVVDCSSIAPSLIESELFGHTRGAYTGAVALSKGRLAEAAGGTVFLDEVGELPLEVQAKLLTFVQDKRIVAVGSTAPQVVDVRIVAASNRNLEEAVRDGLFRADLFYRLKVIHLTLPSLRERPKDIMLLARYFLERFSNHYQKHLRGFSLEASQALAEYTWPGNIRELENIMMRAVLLAQSSVIEFGDLAFSERKSEMILEKTLEGQVEQGKEQPQNQHKGADVHELWGRLRKILTTEIDSAITNEGVLAHPFGRWLSEDLIQAAYEKSLSLSESRKGSVLNRAAAIVGIPSSTFRRRYKTFTDQLRAQRAWRTPGWSQIQVICKALMEDEGSKGLDLLQAGQNIAFQEVYNKTADNATLGSRLMGVTPPTFRRWCAAPP